MTTSNKDDPQIPTVPDSVADVSSPKKFKWTKSLELGYIEEPGSSNIESASGNSDELICFHCAKNARGVGLGKLSRCSKCQVAAYCSRDCQVANWKGGDGRVGHKFTCAAYKRVGEDMTIIFGEDKDEARQDILSKVRFYAFPYAVHRSNIVGRGFLFVQSDSSLAVMSLPTPILSNGRKYPRLRAVILHWLTMKEYDSEVCMDDFELASVRSELKSAVDTYDKNNEVPVLMRFRCGHVAVGIAPLTPDFKLCKILGKEYYGSAEGSGALQLNIDDTI